MWRQDALTPVMPRLAFDHLPCSLTHLLYLSNQCLSVSLTFVCSEEAEEDRNIFDEVEEEEEEDGEDLMGDEMFE